MVCHDTGSRAALLAAERLRKMVKALTISIAGADIQTSVSIGVAIRKSGMEEASNMMRAADKALYAAKNCGRDRVCLFANGMTLSGGKQ